MKLNIFYPDRACEAFSWFTVDLVIVLSDMGWTHREMAFQA